MGRAEAGSAKAIGNKIKAKGLGRLRWYCQACERQMRDANGFKCHITSESHVRQMLVLGENAPKAISDFSQQFTDNFVNNLRTQHGEKKVHINHFYNTIISDREHIHMNSTKFQSLTQFAQHLGKNGICRVEETEKGIFVSWIDNSPETMRKREAIQKKEREEKNDEQREQKMILEQVERARNAFKETKASGEDPDSDAKLLQPQNGEKMSLNLGLGPKKTDTKTDSSPPKSDPTDTKDASGTESPVENATPAPAKISMSFGAQKPKNVFSSAGKKNPLAGKKGPMLVQPKKMTEQERIMKAEMEAMQRKRTRPDSGFANQKRPKLT
ncbi:hypothetical protein N7466_006420 [Penicillium verhagenii]|uniref:uncharacterized protein n=1 Tax=Penicillium verhagenii TaxID=1562060 RepID=UPI0025456F41|nr:uncharacterized protein N7466_006420 [Penicillium verhagenii]KAJ5930927.1 hypothetical protein N7466_006420 [Penicillium verhagenii]